MGGFGEAGAGARRRFGRKFLAQVEERRGASHYGGELQESATEKAERLVRAGLAKLGWREAALAARKNGDTSKLKLAVKLRAETTICLSPASAGLQVSATDSRGGGNSQSGHHAGDRPDRALCRGRQLRVLLPWGPSGEEVQRTEEGGEQPQMRQQIFGLGVDGGGEFCPALQSGKQALVSAEGQTVRGQDGRGAQSGGGQAGQGGVLHAQKQRDF